GDAKRNGGEDDRTDDDLDRLHKSVGERFQADRKVRRDVAERRAENDRDDHLNVKPAIERHARRVRTDLWGRWCGGGRTVDFERGHRFSSTYPAQDGPGR